MDVDRTDKIQLSREGMKILNHSHLAFFSALKGKFNCAAVIHGLDGESSTSFNGKSRPIQSEVKYSIKMSKGLKISVWKDDLTTHRVDAVVNAANDRLDHAGGLALALSEAGGPQIEMESKNIIKRMGRVRTGEAVVTLAGNLPCKMIIHAVGPRVRQKASDKELEDASVFLQAAIVNILNRVKEYNVQSVAIPALSSGLFNFPLSRCADLIVRTLKHYHEYTYVSGQSLDEIRLVNHDDLSVQEMENACQQILGQSDLTVSYSGAVKGSRQRPNTSSSTRLQIGNVTLHLKRGQIEEEKADVIVNTIASNCDLYKGEISKAILAKAGTGIQQEISSISKGWLSSVYSKFGSNTDANSGTVFETRGFRLNCSSVYHTVCAFRKDQGSKEILHKVVSKCLQKAADGNKSSISFPAIGTGNLGFHKTEVAGIMTHAVVEFAKAHGKKSIDVYFVVFPKDNDMFKAFEMEIASLGSSKSQKYTQVPSTSGAASSGRESPSLPHVEIFAPSEEAMVEAKSWTQKMLYPSKNKHTIKNNLIMYFGQKDHDKLKSFSALLNVQIRVFFEYGTGGITITGNPTDVSAAALEVEAMLFMAQEEFSYSEQDYLLNLFPIPPSLNKHTFYNRTVDSGPGRTNKMFHSSKLKIIKVEKIKNDFLEQIFELNRKRVSGQPKQLYQRVKAQFCEPVCRVGFHREYAPPKEQKYGAGIYFTTELDIAMKLWEDNEEEYVYITVAQVLTGNDCIGSPDLIVPRPVGLDPLDRYNSLRSYLKDIYVIFNGQQALPEYIITCKKNTAYSAV